VSANSPTFPRFQLGKQLRELRERARLTTEDVGTQLDCSASTISRIEGGKVGMRRNVLVQLLDLYEVEDQEHREILLALAKQGKQRGWFARYNDLPATYSRFIGLESAASDMRNYEPLVIPGLLQTESYAKAVIRGGSPDDSDEAAASRVRIRLERQALLHRDGPLRLAAVLDEGVLHRLIGGPDVMRTQLKHLSELSRQRNITIQVLPFSGGAYAGMAGSFAILDFVNAPSVVYAENISGDIYQEADEVDRYSRVFDDLRAAALSPLETIKMIEDAERRVA